MSSFPESAAPGGRLHPSERDLGLDVGITRRDFLNTTLLGAGGLLLSLPAPLHRAGHREQNPDWTGFAGVGDYARSNGNTWEVIQAAHAFRDGAFAARLDDATDTGETFDLVVVGAGMSGLGAAYAFQKQRGGRCLLLDNHRLAGGEAKRNEFLVDGVRLIGPQGSNGFGTARLETRAGPLWSDLGLPVGADAYEYQRWAPGIEPLPLPREHYYPLLWSDEFASHGYFLPREDGSLAFARNPFANGLADVPWPEPLKRQFMRWRTWTERPHAGDDYDRWLDSMTYDHYITSVMGLDPAVARYVDPIMASGIGLGSDVLSAYAAYQIRLPGFDGYRKLLPSRRLADAHEVLSSFPGGNDGIARHYLKWLNPEAIRGGATFAEILNGRLRFDALDREGAATRLRLGAMVVRVREDGRSRGAPVEVVYVRDGRIERARAARVVMANGGWSTQHVVSDLPAAYRDAYSHFVRAPMLVVNVALRQWRFMYDQGITAASYRDRFGFACSLRQAMVAGDYRPPLHPDRPNLLTFYVPFSRPGAPLREQAVASRTELLATTYRDYERQIREQLVRLFGRWGFDPRRDIAGIVLNRWGHAYVCPEPGFYFGRDGKPAPPDVIRQPLGRIAFANGELHGHQNWHNATLEGMRAVDQLLG